jgi:hypothetical protein
MGAREMHTQFLWEKLKETGHLEDTAADDNVKLEFKETRLDESDWINLAQNMDKWQGVLNMIMNLRVQQNAGNVFTSPWTRSV